MAALVLIVLAALAVAGCGGGNSHASHGSATQKSSSQTVEQSSGSSTQSATNQTGSGGNSNSTTQSSSGGGSVSSSTSSAGGASLNTFTGTGSTSIRISIGTNSRLLWSNTAGEPFTIRSDDGTVSVNSRAGSGEVALPAGSHSLHVSGRLWTVLVRPV